MKDKGFCALLSLLLRHTFDGFCMQRNLDFMLNFVAIFCGTEFNTTQNQTIVASEFRIHQQLYYNVSNMAPQQAYLLHQAHFSQIYQHPELIFVTPPPIYSSHPRDYAQPSDAVRQRSVCLD